MYFTKKNIQEIFFISRVTVFKKKFGFHYTCVEFHYTGFLNFITVF
jgi:hypothetical protein